MKNHFFFAYWGNKRQEVDNIIKHMSFRGVKTIIEPFCGTSAMSYYISTLYPKKYKYVLNDINNHLIELYRIAQDPQKLKDLEDETNLLIEDITKDKYLELIKPDTLTAYIIKSKIYNIRPGLFPSNYKQKKINIVDIPVVKFLQTENIELTCEDSIKCYEKHKDSRQNIIFLDPPYLDACNDMYSDKQNTNIYEYLHYNQIRDVKARVVLCLENNWIIKVFFSKYTQSTYDKCYDNTHRKTIHVIITNKKAIISTDIPQSIDISI